MEELPKTIIEDVGKAQVEAEQVNKIAGTKIDQEWSKLKLAQAMGLDKKVEESQSAIEKLLSEVDKKMKDKTWESLMTSLFENPGTYYDVPEGFREYIASKFGEAKPRDPVGNSIEISGTGYSILFEGSMSVRLVKN